MGFEGSPFVLGYTKGSLEITVRLLGRVYDLGNSIGKGITKKKGMSIQSLTSVRRCTRTVTGTETGRLK